MQLESRSTESLHHSMRFRATKSVRSLLSFYHGRTHHSYCDSFQIARSTTEITRACAGAGAAALAREGISLSVLGYLAASTSGLLPNAALIDGLTVSCALEGTWTSRFMENLIGA